MRMTSNNREIILDFLGGLNRYALEGMSAFELYQLLKCWNGSYSKFQDEFKKLLEIKKADRR